VADAVLTAAGRRRLGWRAAGLGVALVALALVIGVPLGQLFLTAFEDGVATLRRTLSEPGTARAVVNTVWTSVAVTALAVAGGTAAAFVTERSAAPGRRWLRLAMLASLLDAPLVSAVGWARAYGEGGVLDSATGLHWDGLFGPGGIVVVGACGALPLAYVVVAAGLASRAEPDLERAARAGGATPAQVLRTVTLPLSRPSIAAASALVFVSAVNAFEVPAVLGSPPASRR
jgi:iron(III) transport system permease protein